MKLEMLNLFIFSSSPLKVYVFFSVLLSFCLSGCTSKDLHVKLLVCWQHNCSDAHISLFMMVIRERADMRQNSWLFQLTQPGAKCWENSKVKDRLPEEPAASPHCFPSSFTCFFFKGLRFYVLHPDRNSDTTITVSILSPPTSGIKPGVITSYKPVVG